MPGQFPAILSIYRKPQIIYILVPIFLLIATFYSFVVPPYEAPDEVGHFNYVLHLRQEKRLPVQQIDTFGGGHHAPLYYLIAAIMSLPGDISESISIYRPNPEFMWRPNGGKQINISQHHSDETFPYRGQALTFHLARLASVLMGAGTVLFVFLIGKRIFPVHPEFAGLAATLVAFNPQFLFISGVLNNDNLLILAATALCYHLLCAIDGEEPTKQWVLTGIWLSIATLAKVNGLILGAVVGLFLIIQALNRHSLPFLVKHGLAVGIPLLLLTGWWFMRNWALYGDFLGWSVYTDVFGVNLRQTPLNINDIRHYFNTRFNSFWGRFGWMNLWAPAWFYMWIRLLIWSAIIGTFIYMARTYLVKERKRLSTYERTALLVLAVMVLIYEGYMLWAISKFNESWYQGRYIFPIIGPLMLFMSLGILGWVAERFRAAICLSLALAMCAIALYMPLFVIGPAYKSATLPKWHVLLLPSKTDYQFGQSIRLRGYDVDTADSQIVLNLTWQALETPDFNYSAFVHLLDENDNILMQDDHAPGELAGYLPKLWQPGDIVIGRYTLDTTAVGSLTGPLRGHRFRIGLYNWENGQRLPIQADKNVLGDYLILE